MIDWSRVNELRRDVGEADFGDIVDLFLDEVSEVLGRLEAEPEQLAGNLHFLKGSAASLGFRDLADLCQSGEHRARQAGPDQVDIAEILATFERSKRAFLAGLRDNAAA